MSTMRKIESLEDEAKSLARHPEIPKINGAISNIKTPNPAVGDVWFDKEDGTVHVYYEDFDSHGWIQVGGSASDE